MLFNTAVILYSSCDEQMSIVYMWRS